MEVIDILIDKDWEDLLSKFSNVNFLQSWEWGEFQKSLGSNVIRNVCKDQNQISIAQVYFVKTKYCKFMYCPRGPLAIDAKAFSKLLKSLKELAINNKADFIILEPDSNFNYINQMTKFGFVSKNSSIQPKNTSILDLKNDEEMLLKNMRKTSRQMLRKAKENNIIIDCYNDSSHWDQFVNLLKETSQRQKFTSHSISYLKNQYQIFERTEKTKMYFAKKEKEIVAAAIVLSFRKTSTYLHAASSNIGRNLGASNLLVWSSIIDAKQYGNEFYDFWGISPENEPNHPWQGISIFKNGFGGERVVYPGLFVLPINLIGYNIYFLKDFLRNLPLFKTAHRTLLSKITKG